MSEDGNVYLFNAEHVGVRESYLNTPSECEPNGYSDTAQAMLAIEPGAKPFDAHAMLTRLQEISDENVQVARCKNADYANPDDPFANFKSSEIVGVPVERAMLVRMMDKITRISNLLDRPAEVIDEPILDTCSDLATYALLLRIRLEQRPD